MEVSAKYARVMFDKGMPVRIYDNANTPFSHYGGDKSRPIPITWTNKSELYLTAPPTKIDTWEALLGFYERGNLTITKFEVTMSRGIKDKY